MKKEISEGILVSIIALVDRLEIEVGAKTAVLHLLGIAGGLMVLHNLDIDMAVSVLKKSVEGMRAGK